MVDDYNVLPIPKEPDPEPIARVEEMLGNSSTIIPTNSPSLVVPNQTSESPVEIKPKKKNMAGIIIGLILFLGVVATGAYFIAKPESLADFRSLATQSAKNLSGKQLDNYNDCLKESGRENCNRQFDVTNPVLPKGEDYEPPIDKSTPAGTCPPGYIVCGSGSSAFCGSEDKTCNEQLAERNPDATVQTGVVKCKQDSDGVWGADPAMNYSPISIGPNAVGVKDGKSVLTQVTEQCKKQMAVGGFATSGTTKKYICKVGVKNYTSGQCTENNGKVFTGNLGCFCGTVQVDTNTGHESYTSTCGCNKNESTTVTDEPTPTTPTTSPICTNIKVYKGTVQVTPSTLLPGDAVTIAVVGTGNPTQARFRVNGVQIAGDTDTDPNWTISTTKNTSGEYFVSYTIPTGVTSFLFEGETFAQGAWH